VHFVLSLEFVRMFTRDYPFKKPHVNRDITQEYEKVKYSDVKETTSEEEKSSLPVE